MFYEPTVGQVSSIFRLKFMIFNSCSRHSTNSVGNGVAFRNVGINEGSVNKRNSSLKGIKRG